MAEGTSGAHCEFPEFPSEMSGEQWVEHFWSGGFQPWADSTEAEPLLKKYFPLRGSEGRKDLKVFFPFCGTSPDMRWVADEGHNVIGCEFAPAAGKIFAKNQSLTFTECDVPELEGKLFKYNETNVKIYCCDFYKFNSNLEGQFDIIWDSAAFVAANQKDKQRYADLLRSLLKPDGKLFIYGIDYKDGVIKGPPFPFRDEHCKQFFGQYFNAEYIDGHSEPEEYEDVKHDFIHGLRLLTFK